MRRICDRLPADQKALVVLRVVLVLWAHVVPQAACLPERSVAVGARVVPKLRLLVHRAQVQITLAGVGEGAAAPRAGVPPALLGLLHHGGADVRCGER